MYGKSDVTFYLEGHKIRGLSGYFTFSTWYAIVENYGLTNKSMLGYERRYYNDDATLNLYVKPMYMEAR